MRLGNFTIHEKDFGLELQCCGDDNDISFTVQQVQHEQGEVLEVCFLGIRVNLFDPDRESGDYIELGCSGGPLGVILRATDEIPYRPTLVDDMSRVSGRLSMIWDCPSVDLTAAEECNLVKIDKIRSDRYAAISTSGKSIGSWVMVGSSLEQVTEWCQEKDIKWCSDESNL